MERSKGGTGVKDGGKNDPAALSRKRRTRVRSKMRGGKIEEIYK